MGKNPRRSPITHGTLTGYTNCGCRCEACAAAGKKWREKRKSRQAPRLPIQPILDKLDDSNRRQMMKSLGRYIDTGIPLFSADYWCCKLGLHPWLVYGDLFFQDIWEGDQK